MFKNLHREEMWSSLYDLYKDSSNVTLDIHTIISRIADIEPVFNHIQEKDLYEVLFEARRIINGKKFTFLDVSEISEKIKSTCRMMEESDVISNLEFLLEHVPVFEKEIQRGQEAKKQLSSIRLQLDEMRKENASLTSTKVVNIEVIEANAREMCDLKKEQEVLSREKLTFQEKFDEIVKNNEIKDENISFLERKVTDLFNESMSNLKNLKYRTEELEELNDLLKEKMEKDIEEIQNQNVIIKEIKFEHQLCKDKLALSNENNNMIEKDLLISEDMLKSAKEECNILRTKSRKYEDICKDLEQKVYNLSLESIQSKDVTEMKYLEDELEMLKLNLSIACEEKDDYEFKLISSQKQLDEAIRTIHLNESFQIKMKEEIKTLKTASDIQLLDLENTTDKYIKLNEELNFMKAANLEKDAEIEHLLSILKFCKTGIENIRVENKNLQEDIEDIKNDFKNYKENIKKETVNNIIELENQSLTLEHYVRELKDKLRRLEDKNVSLKEMTELLDLERNEKKVIKKELDSLEIKYSEVTNKISLIEKENINIQKNNEVLEKVHSIMTEEIETLREEMVKREKQCKGNEDRIEQLIKQMIEKDEELSKLSAMIKETNNISLKEENIIKEIELKNVEITSLRQSLSEIEENTRIAEEDAKKIEDLECKIENLEFELTGWQYTNQALEKENDSLIKKTKEAMHMLTKERMKSRNLLEEIRNNKEIDEMNVDENKGEIETLRIKNEKLLLKCVAFETIKRSYDDLENNQGVLENIIEENKQKIEELRKENEILTEKLVAADVEYTEVVNIYNKLKEQYRKKRKDTIDLIEKHKNFIRYSEDKGYEVPKEFK